MERLPAPSIDWYALTPLLILLGGALVLLVVGSLTPRWPKGLYALVGTVSAGAAGTLAIFLWNDVTGEGGPRTMISNAARFDTFAVWITIAVCVATLLAVLITDDYLERERMVDTAPEIYALYLMAAIGAVVMGMANDLIVLFLGLEIMSIAMYVLAASHRRRIRSQESGLKYFVLGGFSSAFFLYGVAMIYGATGTTNMIGVVGVTGEQPAFNNAMSLAGVALLLVGLGFKVAAVPFHFWTPDVYEGAPSPVTAFLASVGKTAAFAAMLRVLVYTLPNWSDDYRPVVWVLAVLTLVVGAVLAVVQTNVKRMLAFSSVSHAGFLLAGVEAAAHRSGAGDKGLGVSSTLLYLMIYAVLVCGTFAVVTAVGRTGDDATDLAGFRGLGRSRPVLALGMTVLLLAQAGVPLTSGFVAKFNIIRASVDENSNAVAIIAMVSAVIAAYLYLRIMVSMWIADPEAGDEAREPVRLGAGSSVAVALAVGFTLVIGFYPQWLIDVSESVARL
jgi:NADH-quinone oxidoreductase subunit N